jgi:hypothetical protein
MLSSVGPVRFIPRQADATAERRRFAALRAAIDDLTANVGKIEKEQDIQLRRIAQIQQDLDELKRLLRKRT